MERPTHRVIHLVVSSNVSMECSQHYHGNHPRQEKNNHQGVHDTERKIIQSLRVETEPFQNNLTKKYVQYLTPDTIATNLPKTNHTISVSRNMTAVKLIF